MPQQLNGRRRSTPAPLRSGPDRAELADVAEMYWVKGTKVEEIAKSIGVSRSTVSRMLARARSSGIIEFTVRREADSAQRLAEEFLDRYSVRARIVPVEAAATGRARLDAVAREAAHHLDSLLGTEMTLSVAWGSTVEAVSSHLRERPIRGLRIVQFNGCGNTQTMGISYMGRILNRFRDATGGAVDYFPVPAFFDSTTARQAMWEERSIRRLLALRSRSDVLLTSVGTFSSELPGHLYRSHYLERTDIESLINQHVVGDLGTTFFRSDGSTHGIPTNARSTGMGFEELRRLPVRVVVVADPSKAEALRSALAASVVTDLVIDQESARATLR